MPSTFEKIASVTLTGTQQTVTFSSIPQTYTDLVLYMAPAQNSGTFGQLDCLINLNGDTGSNYSRVYISGNGSAVDRSFVPNATAGTAGNITGQTLGKGVATVNFMNYSSTSIHKTFLVRGSFAPGSSEIDTLIWRNTAAVTSISLKPNQIYNTEQFISGSTFSLYGIKAA